MGGLALADLRHEWILTLCLVLAIAAVIAPLLLLLGLKEGTIATLRDRLVQDPVYREVRPMQTREYPPDWFETWGKRPEVSFLTPTILAASSVINVVQASIKRERILDLIPTAPGDPLILENGGQTPKGQECVLTSAAAEELGVGAGEVLQVRATRSRGGRREFGEARLKVVSVLGARAGGLPRMYAPLSFVLDVEMYKEGMAVPSRNWKGSVSRPYPSYEGIFVALPERLDPVSESGLIINTGLSSIEPIEASEFRERTGISLPANLFAYDLRVFQNPVQSSSYYAVKNKLRGRAAILFPYAPPYRLKLSGKADRELPVFGLSISAGQARTLGIPELPWKAFEREPPDGKLLQILLPVSAPEDEHLTATAEGTDGPVIFPLHNKGPSLGDYAYVPAELIGILRTAKQRKVAFDGERGTFVLSRSGFRGFRLYARSIDDVVPLTRELRTQGIDVIAQVESIERIRILDRGLTRIFWLVAVVGIAGGIAALIASLYAAVERKKQELSVMRLIGLSRLDVFLFPIYQSVAMAVMSLAAAIMGYLTLAEVINRVFSSDLEMGQKICALPPDYLILASVATTGLALFSSLFGAWKTTQIDPAEALRYE